MARPPLDGAEVTVAVLLPLPKERAAAQILAETIDWSIDSAEGHGFSLCEIPSKNPGSPAVVVALALQPSIGNIHAAMTVIRLRKKFENLRLVIACGIAGAAPTPGSPEKDVYLGDIVVGTAIVQYDFGHRRLEPGVEAPGSRADYKFEIRGAPDKTSPNLGNVVNRLFTLVHSGASGDELPWIKRLNDRLPGIVSKNPRFARPEETDETKYTQIVEGIAARVVRKSDRDVPHLFAGNLGSSNCVLKDPFLRDQLRDGKPPIIGIEMEAAGLAAACLSEGLEFMVVRGICDYCDSNKNDKWQPYAAAVAAAFTYSVIELLPERIVALGSTERNRAVADPTGIFRQVVPVGGAVAATTEASAATATQVNSRQQATREPSTANPDLLRIESAIREKLQIAQELEAEHDTARYIDVLLEVESLIDAGFEPTNKSLVAEALYEIARAYHMKSQSRRAEAADEARASSALKRANELAS